MSLILPHQFLIIPPCSFRNKNILLNFSEYIFLSKSQWFLVFVPQRAVIGCRVDAMEYTIRVRLQTISHPHRDVSGPLVGCKTKYTEKERKKGKKKRVVTNWIYNSISCPGTPFHQHSSPTLPTFIVHLLMHRRTVLILQMGNGLPM